MSHFRIRCRNCGKSLEEDYCAFCEHCIDALLVTEYKESEFRESAAEGIWRFNWLPVHNVKRPQSGPLVYRSEGFAGKLGLSRLYIAFNGYWPEKGALTETCTFKEFEAAVALENAKENDIDGLVVASAGNTARAFAHLSAQSGYPVIIVMPKMCLVETWYIKHEKVVPTVILSDGDYADSIDMAKRIAQISGMPFEGGVKNIAKRDGLGIVMMEAVSKIGRLPDHYFQAVGSGTGGIAAWEMAERFVKDGRFGQKFPQLHLAQNLPFAPMVKAWHRGERHLRKEDLDPALIGYISTRVLSNRYPAYTIKGGVYDALTASGGNMYGITNDEMQEAKDAFEAAEGIDIVPAAAVAVASLMKALDAGAIGSGENVLLNITGGGEARIWAENRVSQIQGEVVSKHITDEEIEEYLCRVLSRNC